jgi:hypothetical protein
MEVFVYNIHSKDIISYIMSIIEVGASSQHSIKQIRFLLSIPMYA